MTNAAIAAIFEEIGDILELQNENPFRIRAYRQGARAIEFHPEPLRLVYERDGREALMAIPGVGEALADKVIELLETGKLYFYDKLRGQIPAILLTLAKVPGVGPKTAQKLFTALHPKDLAELQTKLAQAQRRIQKSGSYKGFHEKTIVKILHGLDVQATLGKRLVLTEALPMAELFIDRLKQAHQLEQIDMVGSLRRAKETVGDIDLIAATDDPKPVLETFVTTPGVTQILAHGDTKAMVMYQQQAHVDLEILPSQEYGSLLQHFTGSKEHNIAFRSLVDDGGLSFSEHGFKVTNPKHPTAVRAIKQAKTDKRWDAKRNIIRCSAEEQVYEAVGLIWIPPELRENSGELLASQTRTLPKLVELADMRGDIHVHSERSGDGREKPEVLIERAIALGYQYLGITDHTKGLGVAGKMTDRQLAAYAKKLRKLNDKYPEIRILPGCELNILANGQLDVDEQVLAELDVVIASVHSALGQDSQRMTDRILKALDNPHVDVLAHPTTRILNYRGEITADWETIFRRAAETQTALEINAYPERLDLDGLRVRRANELGCKFVISSDAHRVEHFDTMRFGLSMARRGWCEKEDVLNTLPVAKFVAWLTR
ncbi:DNA polymerase/3'-5' exonuclease PolX [Candidatus Berkelbacteria bacterium]|nr:DNA polymerase/3'-5' exonuclease PolX [Candidatus Berkelbacteria bacterium]